MEFVKKVLPFTIIISVVSFVLMRIFDSNNGLLQLQTINGIKIYVFNLNQHIQNIQNASDLRPLIDVNIFPEKEWINAFTLEALTNNIAVVFNWLYMPINVFLTPLRFSCYITKLTFTLLGVANDNAIMNLLSEGITKLVIPYIP